MLLLVDLDGVTVDFHSAVCKAHNELTGDNLQVEDIDQWELETFGIKKTTWQQPGFFYDLDPYPGAVEALWKAQQNGHKLWVVTNAMDIDFVEEDKRLWVSENIPFVRGLVFTDKKHLLPGDMLIDDCPEYLENYPGTAVKINRPYNKHVKVDYAFDTLAEAIKAVC